MKRKDVNIIAGSAIIILVAIAAVVAFYPSQEGQKAVRIGHLPILASMPVHVAQENGYFAEQGIRAEVTQMQTSNQLLEALVRGDLDIVVGFSSVPALIAETIDPGKIKIFSASDITTDEPFDSILVKAGSSLESLEDLEGMKIGVFPGSTATNLLKKFFADKGLDASSMEFVQIAPQNQLPALYQGSIDALHTYEPSTSIALQGGNARRLYGSAYAEQLNHNPMGVSLISSAFASRDTELAGKAIAALDKASDFMLAEDSATRGMVIKYMKVDKAVADNLVFAYMSRSDEVNAEALQSYADMLLEIGEMKSSVSIPGLLYSP
jgi:ABC-type nitrate/sulfonate/bicarbonate transport system substrate-binding protein